MGYNERHHGKGRAHMRARLLWLLVFVLALLCALGLMVQADEQVLDHAVIPDVVYLRPVEPALPIHHPDPPEDRVLLCLWSENSRLLFSVSPAPFLCQRPSAFLLPDLRARYHAFHLSSEAG
jgi:hypothetical protein